jgi:undecaprenol kinase
MGSTSIRYRHGVDAPSASFKNHGFRARLGYAFAGIRIVRRREKSFRTQLTCAAAAAGAVAWLRPGWLWCALLLLAAMLVLALEMINAALEYLMDELHPHHSREIGHAKDAAAGAVLLASIAAAAIGAMMVASRLF